MPALRRPSLSAAVLRVAPARTARLLLVVLVAAAAPPSGTSAQGVVVDAGSLRLGVGGRLHSQVIHSSVERASTVDFLVRRARLTFDLGVTDRLSGRIQPEFAGGGLSLKDAWVRMAFAPSFRVTAGRFNRPFDGFQLASSTLLPVIERDGRIPGVELCTGVGRICSLSRLTQALEYSERDVGVTADGRLGDRLRYFLAVTNGPGAEARDDNDEKSFSGRVEVGLGHALTLAANVSVHDYLLAPDVDDESAHATAWGADAEWGGILDPGLHLIAGLVAGENWRADPRDPDEFLAVQLLLSYRLPREPAGLFEAWAPMARVSWADPSRTLRDDAGLLLTPGVMLYIRDRNAVGANLDVYRPEEGSTEYSLKVQSFLHF